MPIFATQTTAEGKLMVRYSSVLNYGIREGNTVTYLARSGEVTAKIDDLKNDGIVAVSLDEISLKDFISEWRLRRADKKEVVVDQNLKEGELLRSDFSKVDVLINDSGDVTRIKLILK